MTFLYYSILYLILIYFIIDTEQIYESYITLTTKGTAFIPKNSNEFPLKTVYVSSFLRCGTQCNQNILCRIFIYDEVTFYCQLYQSDLLSGNITSIGNSTTRVGIFQYKREYFINYNKTCNYCQYSRYLICRNSLCQCPSSTTYWDGYICQNQFYYGINCNSSIQCRQDLNLTCIFGSCQLKTAICKMGATGITFEDIPNISPSQGNIPSVYNGFSWTNGYYLNASIHPTSGYPIVRASGEYVAWFQNVLTIQTLSVNRTVTLNSCVMAAGWSNSLFVTITGYYSSTQLYTTTTALNTYTQTLFVLNWSGLNKILFTPPGSGNNAIGLDNLCVTF